MNKNEKINLNSGLFISVLVIVLMFMLSFWAWIKIPEGTRIPVHWNIDGEVDHYGTRFQAFSKRGYYV